MPHSTQPASFLAPLCLLAALTAQAAPTERPDEAGSSTRLLLRYAQFDPLEGQPAVPPGLAGGEDTDLYLVQLTAVGREPWRQAIRAAGGEVLTYMHDNAHVVRMAIGAAVRVQSMPFVRWVGFYEPAYRLEPVLIAEHAAGQLPVRRYNVVVFDPADKPALTAKIRGFGGVIDNELDQSILMHVTLNGVQLLQAARLDEVQWIDRWQPIELDVNNARIQGGANYIEPLGNGHRGQGIRGEILEGIYNTHPDFQGPNRSGPIIHRCGTADSHGSNTCGIVFGNGNNNPTARGMVPEGQIIYCNFNCAGASRFTIVQELVNNYQGMFQTASWGYALTTAYTSDSADLDNVIFRNDIPITQSQSNNGNQLSRPQAWAKNVISVGGFLHNNNSTPVDDTWSGQASIGPASDGRIKPDLSAFYDSILTTDGPASYTSSFGGTSGATPIVAGHLGLVIQLFTDGVFGNTLKVPGGTRFQNRPHFTTAKALLINSAYQYAFSGTGHDMTRTHQGWGFPDLRRLWDARQKTLIVDEADVLVPSATARYTLSVPSNEPEFLVTLCYNDPQGSPGSTIHRINDLDLKVTSPTGVIFLGNNGLSTGRYSVTGGNKDDRNTVENVFISSPAAGTWTVEVIAAQINQDSHLETPALDADFALIASGGVPKTCKGTAAVSGAGCKPFLAANPAAMSYSGCFSIGETVTVGSAAVLFAGGNQFLLVGSSDQKLPNGVPLPLSLAFAGAPGCSLYNNALITISMPATAGGSSIGVPIPNNPVLVGVGVFWQGVFMDQFANPLGMVTTDSLKTVLGN